MLKKTNMKKGISLVTLIITIAVLLILLSTITFSFSEVLSNTKKKQFAKEIYEVQNLVDKYVYENQDYPYIITDNVLEKIDITINDSNTLQFADEDIGDNNTVSLYPINLVKAGVNNLSRGTKEDGNSQDVYALSAKTGKVYYVKGVKIKSNTYYTLNDELTKLIGIKYWNESK